MFVHNQQVSSPRAVLAGSSPSTRRCLRDTSSRPDARLQTWVWMRSCKNAGPDACRRRLKPGRRAWRLPRPPPPVAVRPCEDHTCAPGRDLGHRGWRSGGCRRAGHGRRRSCRAESGKAPLCMRWGGLARLAAPSPASCLALLAPRAARRGQVPARGTGLPAPPTFPGVAPETVPVSRGETISTASANAAQEPDVNYSGSIRYPQSYSQKAGSYPHPAVVIHRLIHSPSTSYLA